MAFDNCHLYTYNAKLTTPAIREWHGIMGAALSTSTSISMLTVAYILTFQFVFYISEWVHEARSTLAIMSLIWSMWSDTRGSWVGGSHWSSAISQRNSLENRLLKLKGFSPASFALLMIWKVTVHSI